MNRDETTQVKLCPECGAENFTLVAKCWLCHADLKRVAPIEIVAAEVARPTPQSGPSGTFFLVLTVLAIVLVVLVGWGLGEMSLGYLPWFVVIVIPALLATAVRIGRRRIKGQQVTWSEAILTVVVSGAIIHGVLVLVAVAAVAALFIMCLISPSIH